MSVDAKTPATPAPELVEIKIGKSIPFPDIDLKKRLSELRELMEREQGQER